MYPLSEEESRQRINREFEYHPPTRRQAEQYRTIREAGKYFATVILLNTPKGADQSDAIRKVREAVMTANAAIACEPQDAGNWQNLARTPFPPDEVGKAERGPIPCTGQDSIG